MTVPKITSFFNMISMCNDSDNADKQTILDIMVDYDDKTQDLNTISIANIQNSDNIVGVSDKDPHKCCNSLFQIIKYRQDFCKFLPNDLDDENHIHYPHDKFI